MSSSPAACRRDEEGEALLAVHARGRGQARGHGAAAQAGDERHQVVALTGGDAVARGQREPLDVFARRRARSGEVELLQQPVHDRAPHGAGQAGRGGHAGRRGLVGSPSTRCRW